MTECVVQRQPFNPCALGFDNCCAPEDLFIKDKSRTSEIPSLHMSVCGCAASVLCSLALIALPAAHSSVLTLLPTACCCTTDAAAAVRALPAGGRHLGDVPHGLDDVALHQGRVLLMGTVLVIKRCVFCAVLW
jgi:hypothetical protein